jgi:hypothetical protein
LHRAEFKGSPQVRNFKNLLDPFRRIHQLKDDCVGTSRLAKAQQHSQAARIDTVDPCQINHQHLRLTEHSVAQSRTSLARHNSAMAPENTYVSQLLNGYLQHHHLLRHSQRFSLWNAGPASTA